ncbi:MAG: prepilin-type N-terminal cleavage/methylation domain-containing protein [Candidatus Roizmanbacteria bacterium]
MYKKSFTLMEMLVVVGIIALLVSIVAASFSGIQKKARDAKRRADMKSFQNNIEQCYSNSATLVYPNITGGGTKTITINCTNNAFDMTITDPTTLVFTVTQSAPVGTTYGVSKTLEDGTTISISERQ